MQLFLVFLHPDIEKPPQQALRPALGVFNIRLAPFIFLLYDSAQIAYSVGYILNCG